VSAMRQQLATEHPVRPRIKKRTELRSTPSENIRRSFFPEPEGAPSPSESMKRTRVVEPSAWFTSAGCGQSQSPKVQAQTDGPTPKTAAPAAYAPRIRSTAWRLAMCVVGTRTDRVVA
jgi:hypothetical protein